MKTLFALFLISIPIVLNAGELEAYIQRYVKTQRSNFNEEKKILENYKLKKLVGELEPFYQDSLIHVRQKAYYLTYKKGIRTNTKDLNLAISVLLKGCNHNNGGVTGRNLSYLQDFPVKAFNEEARNQINKLLLKEQMQHKDELLLLAGYVKTGKEYMHKRLLEPELSENNRWLLSLALARQGEDEQLNYCLETVKNIPLSNNMVSYFIPKLVYTRQKQAIDYCLELLKSNSKVCSSPDPDNPKNILCGYYIIEKLAPVIVNFPYKVDGTGSLATDDYETALKDIKGWFSENPDYKIEVDTF